MRTYIYLYKIAFCLLALAMGTAQAAATHEADLQKSIPAGGLHGLEFQNLAGRLTLGTTSGDAIVIKAHVVAGGGSDADAAKLASRIALDVQTQNDTVYVTVTYPVDDIDHYSYKAPGLSGNSVNVKYMGERVTVNGGFLTTGVPLHVDVDIQVPKGIHVRAEDAVGVITGDGLTAGVYAKTRDGSASLSHSQGDAYLDTGSGDVKITDHQGSAKADTGSGDAIFENVTGDEVYADTGSGAVTMTHCKASLLYADTGSGDVNLNDVQGSLHLDTGSGDVDGVGVVSGEKIYADTGSGHVRLEGDLSAVTDLYVDTGSGDVALKTSKTPSLRLKVSTGSGDMDINVPGMHNVHIDDGDLYADLGEAKGKGVIDTGSGDASFH